MKLTNPYLPPTPDEAIALAGGLKPGAVVWHDPIQKAVDDYLLMERKAKAWGELRAFADRAGLFGLVAQMDALVHPAQTSSTC